MVSFSEIVEALWLVEGPLDANILKAVFLAGSGGSGKGFISKLSGLSSLGFKVVNVDDAYEYLLVKNNVNPSTDIFTPQGQALREPAKRMMNLRLDLYLAGKLPIIIDATAANLQKISKMKDRLEAAGYDTAMVLVDVSLERSIAGNKARAARGGRNVDDPG